MSGTDNSNAEAGRAAVPGRQSCYSALLRISYQSLFAHGASECWESAAPTRLSLSAVAVPPLACRQVGSATARAHPVVAVHETAKHACSTEGVRPPTLRSPQVLQRARKPRTHLPISPSSAEGEKVLPGSSHMDCKKSRMAKEMEPSLFALSMPGSTSLRRSTSVRFCMTELKKHVLPWRTHQVRVRRGGEVHACVRAAGFVLSFGGP